MQEAVNVSNLLRLVWNQLLRRKNDRKIIGGFN